MLLSDQSIEKEISVSLNDEQTRVIFVDRKHGEMSVRKDKYENNYV